MQNVNGSADQLPLVNPNSYWFKALLVLVFVLATLIRLDDIQALGHLVEREFTLAIFARAYYFQDNNHIEPWRQEVATVTKDRQPILEPPLTEYLVSLIYRVLNNEAMWYARVLTNAFWLIGGVFMYQITKHLLAPETAIVATVYYLFIPMGLLISRSFQPDALMMMMFLISLYSILIYSDAPTPKRLWLSAIITGVTLLIRPLVIFTLFFAFVALWTHRKGSLIRVIDRSFILFWSISLLFPLAYYGYGVVIADFMRWKVTTSFRPHLFATWQYWKTWFEMSAGVAKPAFMVSALIGFLTLRKKNVQALIVGLSFGYLIFCLIFNYHTITHPYYHIQLFPMIGICAAPFIIMIANMLKNTLNRYWVLPAIAIFLFGLYFSYSELRDGLYRTVFEDPSIAAEIGEIVNHSTRTVFVAYHYGLPLEYYGEFSGAPWPVAIDDPFYRDPNEKARSVQERLDSLGFQPEYFVITHFDLFNRKHQDLKSYLDGNCSVFAQTDHFLIYGSCPTNAFG